MVLSPCACLATLTFQCHVPLLFVPFTLASCILQILHLNICSCLSVAFPFLYDVASCLLPLASCLMPFILPLCLFARSLSCSLQNNISCTRAPTSFLPSFHVTLLRPMLLACLRVSPMLLDNIFYTIPTLSYNFESFLPQTNLSPQHVASPQAAAHEPRGGGWAHRLTCREPTHTPQAIFRSTGTIAEHSLLVC
jgi:hypothetical protein